MMQVATATAATDWLSVTHRATRTIPAPRTSRAGLARASRTTTKTITVASAHPKGTNSENHRKAGLKADRKSAEYSAAAPPPAAAAVATFNPTRRGALQSFAASTVASLVLSLGAVHPPLACASDAATSAVPFEGVRNERWVNIPTETRVPTSWAPRPGQRSKQSKFMLYTDTYGPNYRYTSTLPKYVDAAGAVAANAIAVLVQSRGGQESITDLGAQGNIDAAKAFGIETDNITLAEQVSSAARTDSSKQTYYEWELLCPGGSHVLISACISGGALYVLNVEATADQWARNKEALLGVLTSFRVPLAEESTLDVSDRIYNNASSGGFK